MGAPTLVALKEGDQSAVDHDECRNFPGARRWTNRDHPPTVTAIQRWKETIQARSAQPLHDDRRRQRTRPSKPEQKRPTHPADKPEQMRLPGNIPPNSRERDAEHRPIEQPDQHRDPDGPPRPFHDAADQQISEITED